MNDLENVPSDTVEASGLCQAGYHDSCDGYTRESGEGDIDLCGCECHEIVAQSLYGGDR